MRETILILGLEICLFTNSFGQSDFKTKQITVFKNGVVLFEKEAKVDVINNTVFFNTLPFGQEQDNTTAIVGYNQQNTKNVIIGTMNFYASNNNVQEVRVLPNNLRLVLEKNSKDQQIDLKYLQNGLMWIPNYYIKLIDNQSGSLTLNATVLNDVENIDNADINLAVGYPYFPYSNIRSPLTEKTSVSEMLNLLNYQTNNLKNYNSQYTQENTVVIGYGNMKKDDLGEASAKETQQTEYEDLFFYSKKNFSIRKNEVVNIALMNLDISYKDIYSVELNSSRNVINYNGVYNINKPQNVVWHSIKFKNISNSPLTSGIVYFQKYVGNEIKYISQGQLKHTPSGEIVTSKVSITPDIMIDDFDSEIRREELYSKNLFTIQGEISIVNHKSQTISLLIDRHIVGELVGSDKPWKFESSPILGSKFNSENIVHWSIEIEPNSSEIIKYSYKVLAE